MNIFVYGTLKRGFWNNRLLHEARFVKEALVQGYKLMGDGIPFAIPQEGSTIRGEIFDIGDPEESDEASFILRRLDGLEGHPNGYLRTATTTVDADPVSLYVWRHGRAGTDCPVINGAYEWQGRN